MPRVIPDVAYSITRRTAEETPAKPLETLPEESDTRLPHESTESALWRPPRAARG